MDIVDDASARRADVEAGPIVPVDVPLDAAATMIELTQRGVELMKPKLTVTDTINTMLGIKPGELAIGSITAPEMNQAEAEAAAEEMTRFRVKIDWRNPAVCFDGRNAVIEDGQKPLDLGAHLAGGAETPLVAAESLNFVLKGQALLDYLESKEFRLGRHEADSNIADNYANGCGCGACDGCRKHAELLNASKAQAAPATAALMGADYEKSVHDKLQLVPFTEDLRDTSAARYTEILRDDGKGVHGHNEWIIEAEYEDGVSFDRDAYTAATGKKVFPIQFWYLKRLAEAFASHPQSNVTVSEAYHSMVDFQVATYIGLCDGNHRVAVYQPAEVPAAA